MVNEIALLAVRERSRCGASRRDVARRAGGWRRPSRALPDMSQTTRAAAAAATTSVPRGPVRRLARCMLAAVLGVVALGGSVGVRGAHAASPDRKDFDALIHEAGAIIEGEVVSIDSRAGGTDAPLTRVTLRVVEQLDGARWVKGDRFVFDLPMGELPDGRFVDLVELPVFVPGETYLVFYTAATWYQSPVVGWSQGLLRLTRRDGKAWVWTRSDGRCVSGLGRAGLEVGPFVGPWPTPDGWPERKITDPHLTPGGPCLDADDLRARLRRRLLELGVVRSGAVQQTPASAGEIPFAPAGEGD